MSANHTQWQTPDHEMNKGATNDHLLYLLVSLFVLLLIALYVQVYAWNNLSTQVTHEEDRLLRWQTLAEEYHALQGHKKTNWMRLPSAKYLQAWFNAQHAEAFQRFNITSSVKVFDNNQEALVLALQATDFAGFINWLYQISASTNAVVENWDINATDVQGQVSGQLVLRLVH